MEIYQDSSRSIQDRVADLLSKMTLEEKAAQLCGNLVASFLKDGVVSKEKLKEQFSDGLGRFTQYSLAGMSSPIETARISNEVQRFFVEQTRLGIPVALQAENLSGYPAVGGTVFPAMINAGSTWNPELVEQMSRTIGEESKAVGISSAMSPVIDVSRDPWRGRTYETFGEDHYLITQMGNSYIRGMQSKGVSCIAKHFLGYAETQAGLNIAAIRLNSRELYEVFATPFETADKEVGLHAMMASYSEIDGLCVGANTEIARKLLRDTMGFEGMLISDGAAIWKIYDFFHLTSSYAEAGLLAKLGGLDSEIPVGGAYRMLPDYVRSGQLDEAYLDESVRRVLTIKFRCGLFENPYVDEGKVTIAMTNSNKRDLSRQMAEQSIIMLKNKDKLLPLKKECSLAVIGPHGDSLRYPISGYTYPAYIEMIDASKQKNTAGQVTFQGIMDEEKKAKDDKKPSGGAFSNLNALYTDEQWQNMDDVETALLRLHAKSLVQALGERFPVRFAKGCEVTKADRSGFAEAVAAAQNSDVVVMALGGNCGWAGDVTGGEGKDRASLELPGVQQQLLEAVAAAGKPIVLVLYGPGCFSTTWAEAHVDAILEVWMPGPYGAHAIADILDGTKSPSGKLPVTVPRSVGQVPIYYNHKTGSGYQSGGDINTSVIFSGGYTDEINAPLYPFGYGLSYTEFEIGNFSLDHTEITTEGTIKVECSVKNKGNWDGAQVIQLYAAFEGAHVTRPVMQLVGFARVALDKGQQKNVAFILDMAQMGYYNEYMEFVMEPGKLKLMLGTSAHDLLWQQKITVTGKKANLMGKRKYTCHTSIY